MLRASPKSLVLVICPHGVNRTSVNLTSVDQTPITIRPAGLDPHRSEPKQGITKHNRQYKGKLRLD